jgi:hypothetical protein
MEGPFIKAINSVAVAFKGWEGPLTRIFEKLAPAVQPVVDGLIGMVDKALPGIEKAMPGVVAFFKTLGDELPGLGKAAGELFAVLGKPENQKAIKEFLHGLMATVSWIIKDFIPFVIKVSKGFQTVSNWFSDLDDKIEKAGKATRKWLIDLWQGFVDWVKSVVSTVAGLPGKAWNALATLGAKLKDRASTAWQSFRDKAGEKWTAIRTWITGLPLSAYNALSGLAGKLTTKAGEAWNAFLTKAKLKWEAIKDWARLLPASFVTAMGNLGKALSDKFSGAVKAVLEFLGIKSPSKVFRDIGVHMVEGLAVGIEGKMRSIPNLLGKLREMAWSKLQAAGGGLLNMGKGLLDALGLGGLGGIFGGGKGVGGTVGNAANAWRAFARVFALPMGGRAPRSNPSDHPVGKAIDVMTTNPALHAAIIAFFKTLPGAKYWISRGMIGSASQGWKPRPYGGPNPHTDHVHTSFFHKGGRLPEDIVGFGARSGGRYELQGGERIVAKGGDGASAGLTINGGVHLHVDPRSIDDVAALITMIRSVPSTARQMGVGPRVRSGA